MNFSEYPTHALMKITHRPELVFVEGQGMWLTDHKGKRYLDFLQGWAVNCLGHGHPVMQQALLTQSKKLINPSPAFFNEPATQLANLLIEHSGFDRVFFASSGAEANEGAIKLARKWGKKHKNGAYEMITFEHGFHGRTLATMSASGKEGWDTMFAPQVPGFPKAILNNLESVKQRINHNTVAIMLEPIQGEGGVIPATQEFMSALRELTQQENILLITDEVQTGMGRTGKLFAHQAFGVQPDIMTLGKGIGGGVPLAALLATESVACFEPGEQGGTYNGNPLMTAVGVAIFNQINEPHFLETVVQRGQYLSQRLLELAKTYELPGERGVGLLRALCLNGDYGSQLVEAARQLNPEGLLLNSPRPHLLRFMPALNITVAEIDQMIDMLSGLLKQQIVAHQALQTTA